jgi:hypothetical protein
VLSTITVMNTDDSGTGSLRAAIEQANVDAAQDTIAFAPSVTGTISLLSALPDLSAGMNIVGPGPSALTVARSAADGTPMFGVFTVSAGARVAISGLTITGGLAATSGGGITNSGVLSLKNSVISNNTAGSASLTENANGGGIANSGTLTLTDSTVFGNSALSDLSSEGGGIDNSGTLSVVDSTFSSNHTGILLTFPISVNGVNGDGGGISNSGTLLVAASTFSSNVGLLAGGGIDNSGTLSVVDSTFSSNHSGMLLGFPLGARGDGGGISNSGTLLVAASTFSSNVSIVAGGGIEVLSPGTVNVNVTDSTFSGNSAGEGGGIEVDSPGTVNVTDSTFSGNSADLGGGINNLFNGNGSASIDSSKFSDNMATIGGGIDNYGSLTITGSALAGNTAVFGSFDFFKGSLGGGIENEELGTLSLMDSTLNGNSATGNIEYPSVGGGIGNRGTLSVTFSTLSGNSASVGGGIANFGNASGTPPPTASLVDTIAAGNTESGSNAASDIGGDVTGSYNLIGTGGSGGLKGGQDGNIVLTGLTGLGLSPLGDYVGPTQTMALLPGSPAIDAGIAVSGVTTDQRGITRPQGSAPDIGAFESRGFMLAVVSGDDQSTPIGLAFPVPLVVSVVSPFGEPVAGGHVTFAAALTGASAELVGSPAIIDNNGQASATASANGFGGTYSVTVGAAGADTVALSLTNEDPRVVSLQRFGVHDQPTRLVLTFSEPMDAVRADNHANYRLVWARPAQRHGAKHENAIPIRYARYNAAAQTVTIRPIRRLPLRRTFMLTVVGTPPGGLTNTSGTFLDGAGTGQPGSDFTEIVNRKSLAGEVGRHKTTR